MGCVEFIEVFIYAEDKPFLMGADVAIFGGGEGGGTKKDGTNGLLFVPGGQ